METTFWMDDGKENGEFKVKIEFDIINCDFDYDGPMGIATQHVPPELEMQEIKRKYEGGDWEDWSPKGEDEDRCQMECWEAVERLRDF